MINLLNKYSVILIYLRVKKQRARAFNNQKTLPKQAPELASDISESVL